MSIVSHTNDTRNFMHVGAVTIPPGETRDVDASLLPGYKPEGGAPDAAPVDPLAKLLAGAVKNVVGELPNLSVEDLARALELEQDGQARKSMIEAITVETLRRAAALGAPAAQQSGDQPQDDQQQDGQQQDGQQPGGQDPAYKAPEA